MKMYKKVSLALVALAAIALSAPPVTFAGEAQDHVVGVTEIQARIDQQISRVDADRQVIQTLLQRADVRDVAGSVGLDLERASAAASVLSGASLETVAAQVRAFNSDLAGGDGTLVVSTTAVIIVLLVLILLAR